MQPAAPPRRKLARHIGEAVQALRAHAAPAVLAGHSYGGMVITGAADAAPSRVKALVYADAYVPDDGASRQALPPASDGELPAGDQADRRLAPRPR